MANHYEDHRVPEVSGPRDRDVTTDRGVASLTLGEFIRERRRALGITQEQLAEMISGDDEYVRQSDISRIETGQIRLPRTERLGRIATALDLSLGDLLQRAVGLDGKGHLVVDPAEVPPSIGDYALSSELPIWDATHPYHRLFSLVMQAVIITDTAGVIRYWNDYAERLYGWKAAEVIGRPIGDITVIDDAMWQEQAGMIMEHLRAGRRWGGEFLVRGREGSPFMAYVSLAPMLNKAGKVIAVFGTSHEITRGPGCSPN